MKSQTRAIVAAMALTAAAVGQDAGSEGEDGAAADAAAASQAQPAQAEPLGTPVRVEPVVVTARKWEELAQDVPQSLSVIGRQTIRDAGLTSIREAAELVPNLHMTEFSSRRLSFPTFRGISTGVGDPSVATYIDGVPQLDISSTNISLLDVERIEFLRGPQGTLFGRNSIGGVIKLETARPTNTHRFRLDGTLGTYNLQEYTLNYSGPLVEDKWFIGLSGMYSERDGYTVNNLTGNDVDSRESTFLRGKLVFTPDDRNEFTVNAYHERARDGGFALGFLAALRAQPHRIAEDFEGLVNRDIYSSSLTWNHYGDDVEVTSITSFTDWDIDEEADFDFSPLDGIRRYTGEDQRSFFQEFRVASPTDQPVELGDGYLFRWLAGATFFASDGLESVTTEVRPAGAAVFMIPAGVAVNRGDFDDYGFALFGQATLEIDERWELTAGLRFDYEKKEAGILSTFDGGGGPFVTGASQQSESFDEFAPKFGVAYHVTEQAMVYGSIARGFKAGGFNLMAPVGSETFGTESSWTYEAGLKTTLLDERLVANMAVFYIDWDDLQLSLFDPVGMSGFTSNAGQATSMGFEMDVTARVTEYLDVFGGFGLTDATFDSFVDQFGTNVANNELAFVPETTFNVGAQLRGKLSGSANWFVRGDYIHTGTYYLDAGNTQSDSFGLANFRLGVEWPNVSVTGWIRNAFDDEYVQVAFQPNPADPTIFVAENGAPQTVGVTVSVSF